MDGAARLFNERAQHVCFRRLAGSAGTRHIQAPAWRAVLAKDCRFAAEERNLAVGGRTALDLQGFTHDLSASRHSTIHLYGTESPPGWLAKLPLKETFRFHRSQVLFKTFAAAAEALQAGTLRELQGPFDWPLIASTLERVLPEMLDRLPGRESFHQVDMLVERLRTLSPRRLQMLLTDCRCIKVKRLFFWFADRHCRHG